MLSSLQDAEKFVDKFTKGEYTPEEHAAFLQWLKGASTEELTFIMERHESMEAAWVLAPGPSAAWLMQLEQKLNGSVDTPEGATVIVMRADWRWRRGLWVAAAAVVILLITGTYMYVQKMGSKLGTIADREKLLSMTFVNPRGEAQKEMVLEDGSKVWLNAGSELKYPRKFSGSERLVELSGEAFFDVAGSVDRPFRVRAKGAEVEVLGTFFTVMAYDDEPENITAVVSGKVKVTNDKGYVVVRPGEEAEIVYTPKGDGNAPVLRPIVSNIILARKNGIYSFRNMELSTILREVARAYNVTIQYQSNVGDQRIDGSLDLNKTLEQTLQRLDDLTEPYHTRFNHIGKKIIASSTI